MILSVGGQVVHPLFSSSNVVNQSSRRAFGDDWIISLECRRQRQKPEVGLVSNRNGGIGLGGILVILGIVLIIFWSFWWGLIIGLVGLVLFGGFAKGKWY